MVLRHVALAVKEEETMTHDPDGQRAKELFNRVLDDGEVCTCWKQPRACPGCLSLIDAIADALRQARAETYRQCGQIVSARIAAWLTEAQTLPDEDRVGYPPFALMQVLHAIEAQARAEGRTEAETSK